MARTKRPNRGSLQLARLCPEHGDLTRIAEEIGAGVDLVSRWRSGAARPNSHYRGELLVHYGISWRLWDQPVEEVAA